MTDANRAQTVRRNRNSAGNMRVYVDGNTVRKVQEIPERTYEPQRTPARKRKSAQPERIRQAKPKRVSEEVLQNRERAMGIGKGYVIFLAVVCTAILFFCIHYLQLKSEITSSMKTVAVLESELSDLKEDNDAYYSQVTSNVDINTIKKIAIGRLGMKYPSEEQVMVYETEGNSYVRQYQDIPDTK